MRNYLSLFIDSHLCIKALPDQQYVCLNSFPERKHSTYFFKYSYVGFLKDFGVILGATKMRWLVSSSINYIFKNGSKNLAWQLLFCQ